MTRVTRIEGNRVTLGGETYEFPEEVRWVLELSAMDGCEVEVVVVDGKVRAVSRVYGAVKL